MCVPVCEGKRERDSGGRLGLRYKEEIFLTCSKNSNWVLADLFTVTFLEKITNLLLRPRLKNLLLSLPHTHARTSKHLLEHACTHSLALKNRPSRTFCSVTLIFFTLRRRRRHLSHFSKTQKTQKGDFFRNKKSNFFILGRAFLSPGKGRLRHQNRTF